MGTIMRRLLALAVSLSFIVPTPSAAQVLRGATAARGVPAVPALDLALPAFDLGLPAFDAPALDLSLDLNLQIALDPMPSLAVLDKALDPRRESRATPAQRTARMFDGTVRTGQASAVAATSAAPVLGAPALAANRMRLGRPVEPEDGAPMVLASIALENPATEAEAVELLDELNREYGLVVDPAFKIHVRKTSSGKVLSVVRGGVPVDRIEDLAAHPKVHRVTPGKVPAGDTALRARLRRMFAADWARDAVLMNLALLNAAASFLIGFTGASHLALGSLLAPVFGLGFPLLLGTYSKLAKFPPFRSRWLPETRKQSLLMALTLVGGGALALTAPDLAVKAMAVFAGFNALLQFGVVTRYSPATRPARSTRDVAVNAAERQLMWLATGLPLLALLLAPFAPYVDWFLGLSYAFMLTASAIWISLK